MAEKRMEGAQLPELLLRGEDHINEDVYCPHTLHQGGYSTSLSQDC